MGKFSLYISRSLSLSHSLTLSLVRALSRWVGEAPGRKSSSRRCSSSESSAALASAPTPIIHSLNVRTPLIVYKPAMREQICGQVYSGEALHSRRILKSAIMKWMSAGRGNKGEKKCARAEPRGGRLTGYGHQVHEAPGYESDLCSSK